MKKILATTVSLIIITFVQAQDLKPAVKPAKVETESNKLAPVESQSSEKEMIFREDENGNLIQDSKKIEKSETKEVKQPKDVIYVEQDDGSLQMQPAKSDD